MKYLAKVKNQLFVIIEVGGFTRADLHFCCSGTASTKSTPRKADAALVPIKFVSE